MPVETYGAHTLIFDTAPCPWVTGPQQGCGAYKIHTRTQETYKQWVWRTAQISAASNIHLNASSLPAGSEESLLLSQYGSCSHLRRKHHIGPEAISRGHCHDQQAVGPVHVTPCPGKEWRNHHMTEGHCQQATRGHSGGFWHCPGKHSVRFLAPSRATSVLSAGFCHHLGEHPAHSRRFWHRLGRPPDGPPGFAIAHRAVVTQGYSVKGILLMASFSRAPQACSCTAATKECFFME